MANSKSSSSSSSTSTTTTKRSGFSYIINVCAFVAVVIGGLALFISMILSKCGISASFVSAMQIIANAIGWAVLCVLSFNFIKRRKKIWMWVVWVIAVVMIVIGLILV